MRTLPLCKSALCQAASSGKTDIPDHRKVVPVFPPGIPSRHTARFFRIFIQFFQLAPEIHCVIDSFISRSLRHFYYTGNIKHGSHHVDSPACFPVSYRDILYTASGIKRFIIHRSYNPRMERPVIPLTAGQGSNYFKKNNSGTQIKGVHMAIPFSF